MFESLGDFYRSPQWTKLRAVLMTERVNDNGELICEECNKPIVKAYDCIAHHKIELTEENVNDFAISLNPDNIALIHHRCHNEIHQRFEGFCRRVFLVYGSPCSGKTTWVHENANRDDLILDIDALWEAVCLSDKYHKPSCLKANVFGLRDALIDQIRTRQGNWHNAYVIGGYPLKTDRDRMCAMLNAEPVFIDESLQTCLSRTKDRYWAQFVYDWFDSFIP